MTTTICTSPAQRSSTRACSEVSSTLRSRLEVMVSTVMRQSARFWGGGSSSLSERALDATGVASFHR